LENIRSFINELENLLIEENTLTEEARSWIIWAKDKRDSLDRLINFKTN
jgi:hypothetical protein